MSVYGDIFDKTALEAAATSTLQTWLPSYLGEVERKRGLTPGWMARPRTWTTRNDFDKWPEETLPCMLLVSPGLAAEPLKDGNGRYRSVWFLGIAVIVQARNKNDVELMCGLYTAAIRAAVVQHPSLGGVAEGVDWVNERYDDLPSTKGRTLAAGQVIFEVEVADVVSAHDGPAAPDPDPETPPALSPEYPIVQQAIVNIKE